MGIFLKSFSSSSYLSLKNLEIKIRFKKINFFDKNQWTTPFDIWKKNSFWRKTMKNRDFYA